MIGIESETSNESNEDNINKQIMPSNKLNIIIRRTLDGIYLDVSESVSTLLGYRPEDLIGKSCFEFIHPDDIGDFLKPFSNGEIDIATFTYRVKHASGYYKWFETTVSAVKEPLQNKTIEVLSISKDVTVWQNTSEQLIEAGALSITGQLAAGIMHEIRNPLTTVKGFLQLMSSETVINKDYLTLMLGEIERMEKITRELMLLGKPSNREFTWVNLIKLLEDMMLLLETVAFKNKVKFQFKSAFSSLYIYCDETKMKQVFINLIKNGMEAMKSGGVLQIIISCEDDQGPVKIEVIDEGVGISTEDVERIGEPFFTTKKTGNGLGLMMCFNIIQEHKGKLTIHSQKGKGSNFMVELPKWSKKKI